MVSGGPSHLDFGDSLLSCPSHQSLGYCATIVGTCNPLYIIISDILCVYNELGNAAMLGHCKLGS